jgi:hypothetical protein
MVSKMKKDLLIITCGIDPKFQYSGRYDQQEYDVAIIDCVGQELTNTASAAYFEKIPGNKWNAIQVFAARHDVTSYGYIYCLDGEVVTTWEKIAGVFNVCRTSNLDLAQPALTPDSTYNFETTVATPGVTLHKTNTVDSLCPVFSKQVWADCTAPLADLPIGTGNGFGGYWADVLDSATGTTKFGGGVAVLDCLPVTYYGAKAEADLDSKWFADQGYVNDVATVG